MELYYLYEREWWLMKWTYGCFLLAGQIFMTFLLAEGDKVLSLLMFFRSERHDMTTCNTKRYFIDQHWLSFTLLFLWEHCKYISESNKYKPFCIQQRVNFWKSINYIILPLHPTAAAYSRLNPKRVSDVVLKDDSSFLFLYIYLMIIRIKTDQWANYWWVWILTVSV